MQDMQDASLTPYLSQLDNLCAAYGLTLSEVCRAEGIADTTLARWRKAEAHCRFDTAQALVERINLIVGQRIEAAKRHGEAA